MRPESSKTVTPSPYFEIGFNCSNRAFYEVKAELYEIANQTGIEIEDGYISEKCDYEGDLQQIIIYRQDTAERFIDNVLNHYEIDAGLPPTGINIVLAIV